MDRILSITAIVISLIAIIISGVAVFSLECDFQNSSFTIGTLTLLVTLLIGWQIYNVLDLDRKIQDRISVMEKSVDDKISKEAETALFVSLAQLGMTLSHRVTRNEKLPQDDKADAIQMLLNALCVWSQHELNSSLAQDAYQYCIDSLNDLCDNNNGFAVEKAYEKDLYVQAAIKTGNRKIIDYTERIHIQEMQK